MRNALHARSPDGREWAITVRRLRLPAWPDSDFDVDDWSHTVPEAILGYVVLAPIFWLVIPLLRVIAALPVVLVRSLFSTTRYVEAECRWPSTIGIRWETSRERAPGVAAEIAARLSAGYADLDPDGAARVFMTAPPGLEDLDS